jgi:hypothetical protein
MICAKPDVRFKFQALALRSFPFAQLRGGLGLKVAIQGGIDFAGLAPFPKLKDLIPQIPRC